MALIPQHVIDDILARTDVVNVIDARVPLKKAGKDYVARCPFHDEKTPSFHVSPSKQIYYCFGCHAHGNAIRFLMEYERLEFRDALQDLAQAAGIALPVGDEAALPDNSAELLAQLAQVAQRYQEALKADDTAQDYLRGRGVNTAMQAHFGLGFAPPRWDFLLHSLGRTQAGRQLLLGNGLIVPRDQGDGHYDRFRDRIMFPIQDARGRIVGFGGRGLKSETQPKYLNSPETSLYHKGDILYGFYQAREAIRNTQRVVVVEGYMDVIALHQHDIAFAVATSGTAVSTTQLDRLFRAAPEIIFCFDGDRAGRAAAWRALENGLGCLQEGRLLRFLFLPDGEDPDSLLRKEGKDAFLQRLPHALPALDYLFVQLQEQVDASQLDGKARLAALAKPYLDQVPDGPMRALYEQHLRELIGLAPIQSRLPMRSRRSAPQSRLSGKLSHVARSIALILQHPAHPAWADVDRIRLHASRERGVPLFCRILDLVRDKPNLSTAMLLNRFENDPVAEKLARLAGRPLATEFGWSESDEEAEIIGCVAALNDYARQARFEMLNQRLASKENPLSADELQEWMQLGRRNRPTLGH